MKASEIAQRVHGRLQGDAEKKVRGVAGLETATPDDLSFAEDAPALARAAHSQAGCILIPESATLPGHTAITVANPKLAFTRAAMFVVAQRPPTPGIHPTAVIDPSAKIASNVTVGPHVVIERSAVVGSGTRLGAGVFLGEGVQVGADCTFHPRVTVYPGARIGNRVVLHAGVVVGSDGFGYVFDEGRHHKFPQVGGMVIEDDVEIGSNTTVDRGSLGTTVIGEGTKIDNLVQIAHNVRIGRHTLIAAQTGISGSAEIGNFVVMAGQVGVGPRARIGDQAVIAGQAGVLDGKVVRKGSTLWGTPARPIAQIKQALASFSNLSSLERKVNDLIRRLPPPTR
jgi:UDP-3-O-[3-hydroxymyristoyl] glucosamine N-acyltransferase